MSKDPIEMLDEPMTVKTTLNVETLLESNLKVKQIKRAIADYEKNKGYSEDLIKTIKLIVEV